MSAYLRMLLDQPASIFQSRNLDTSNNSILITWMQNRLREHFLTVEARERQVKERKDYATTPKIDQFDVVCHDLKVLDAEVNQSGDSLEDWDKFMDLMMGIDPSSRPPRSEHQVYRVGRSRISLTYKTDKSDSQEFLHLLAEVGQIDDIDAVEVHPYYPWAEKKKIDIHVKAFPVLESWVVSRDVKKMEFPLPTCYFGKCEVNKKVSVETLAELASTEDNIMSKVATAMSVENRESIFESHRMLLLQDIERERFEKWDAAKGSRYLSYLNVTAALKELAKLHCVSWAFTEIEQKSLKQMWPFLGDNSKLISLIMDKATANLPSLLTEMEEHLEELEAPDKAEIMSAIRKLNSSSVLKETLERAMKPSRKGPICLIHGSLSSAYAFFRHTILPNADISLIGPHPLPLPLSSLPTTSNNDETTLVNEPMRITPNERHVGFDLATIPNRTRKKSSGRVVSFSTSGTTTRSLRLVTREVRILEWQNASIGSPMMDAAFLILTSLPVGTRKYHTTELLNDYWISFEETAAHFHLKCNWTNEAKLKNYLHGLLFACIILLTKTFPQIIPERKGEHLEVLREVIRELISHKLLQ